MTIQEVAILLQKNIEITFRTLYVHQWQARFEGAEVKQEGVLVSIFGTGNTPEKALTSYVNVIKGKTLVFGAYAGQDRVEYAIPKDLTI